MYRAALRPHRVVSHCTPYTVVSVNCSVVCGHCGESKHISPVSETREAVGDPPVASRQSGSVWQRLAVSMFVGGRRARGATALNLPTPRVGWTSEGRDPFENESRLISTQIPPRESRARTARWRQSARCGD